MAHGLSLVLDQIRPCVRPASIEEYVVGDRGNLIRRVHRPVRVKRKADYSVKSFRGYKNFQRRFGLIARSILLERIWKEWGPQ